MACYGDRFTFYFYCKVLKRLLEKYGAKWMQMTLEGYQCWDVVNIVKCWGNFLLEACMYFTLPSKVDRFTLYQQWYQFCTKPSCYFFFVSIFIREAIYRDLKLHFNTTVCLDVIMSHPQKCIHICLRCYTVIQNYDTRIINTFTLNSRF
jgi:hypothetical protein